MKIFKYYKCLLCYKRVPENQLINYDKNEDEKILAHVCREEVYRKGFFNHCNSESRIIGLVKHVGWQEYTGQDEEEIDTPFFPFGDDYSPRRE